MRLRNKNWRLLKRLQTDFSGHAGHLFPSGRQMKLGVIGVSAASYRNIPISLKIPLCGSKRVKAFHEKAGRSQGNSGFIVSFCSLS